MAPENRRNRSNLIKRGEEKSEIVKSYLVSVNTILIIYSIHTICNYQYKKEYQQVGVFYLDPTQKFVQ